MLSKRLVSQGVAVLVAAGVVGCGSGSTGAQGPAGPPADRSKLYCKSEAADLKRSGNLSVSVTCNAKTDIPWQGACEASGVPTGMYLSVNEPLDWENADALPGWTCGWAAYGIVDDTVFGGAAQICCYPVGTSQ